MKTIAEFIKNDEELRIQLTGLLAKLEDFPTPEDLAPFKKKINKVIPWYRRNDFYSYMTYLVLAQKEPKERQNHHQNMQHSQFNNYDRGSQDRNNQDRGSQDKEAFVVWTNYSPRSQNEKVEFKAFISEKCGVDSAAILNVSPKKFCSFITLKDESSYSKTLSSLPGSTFKGRTIKAQKKTNQ